MHLFKGTDAAAGVDYLLTIYPDGTGELTQRPIGWPGAWGPPVRVVAITPEGEPIANTTQAVTE